MHVQVPTFTIRNEEIFLSNEEFLLYTRLCFLFFKNYRNEEIKIDHKKLMGKLLIGDSRTLKTRLNQLHKHGLIHNKIDKLPRKGEMVILFNEKVIKESEHFTMMNAKIFDYIGNISSHAFRLLFYYKSHINLKDKVDYCFVGIETLKHRLKMGGHTIKLANDELVNNKLIKIEKHKLTNTDTYNEDDELIFDRYNNHYIVSKEMF
jgi:hypothetical protein